MRRFKLFILTVIIAAFMVNGLTAGEKSEAYWQQFSQNLVKGLKSDNMGVKLSAMQMVIRYRDYVDASAARFDVMNVFTRSTDRQERQLALVTLDAIGNTLDMGRLERQLHFEEDTVIKNQIAVILAERGRLPQYFIQSGNQLAGF